MHWAKSGSDHGYQSYTLYEKGRPVLILRYNAKQKMARITFGAEKRVFRVEQSSIFAGNKMILQNEYGYSIGSLKFENKSATKGNVWIEEEQYAFQAQNIELTEWIIYLAGKNKPIAECAVDIAAHQSADPESSNYDTSDSISSTFLLLTLCWYLFSVGSAKAVEEYAI